MAAGFGGDEIAQALTILPVALQRFRKEMGQTFPSEGSQRDPMDRSLCLLYFVDGDGQRMCRYDFVIAVRSDEEQKFHRGVCEEKMDDLQ